MFLINANYSSDLIWISGVDNKENPLHTPESTGRDELRFLTTMSSVYNPSFMSTELPNSYYLTKQTLES